MKISELKGKKERKVLEKVEHSKVKTIYGTLYERCSFYKDGSKRFQYRAFLGPNLGLQHISTKGLEHATAELARLQALMKERGLYEREIQD